MAARKKPQNPLNDLDGDDEPAPAKESAVERVLSKEREEAEETDDDPVIDLSGEEDDEPEVSTRAAKKAERGRIREENEALRIRSEAAERLLQETLRQQSQYQQPQQPQNEFAVYDQQIQREQDMLLKEYEYLRAKGSAVTKEELADYQKRVNEHNERDADLKTAKALHRRGIPLQQENPVVQQARMRYPDVASNPQASNWATARLAQLVYEGKPDNWDTFDLAVQEARQRFKIGKGAPSPQMRTRLAGHSRGGGSGAAAQFVMTKEHRKNADALYSHIKDPNKRYTQYAKTVGAKILAGDDD